MLELMPDLSTLRSMVGTVFVYSQKNTAVCMCCPWSRIKEHDGLPTPNDTDMDASTYVLQVNGRSVPTVLTGTGVIRKIARVLSRVSLCVPWC